MKAPLRAALALALIGAAMLLLASPTAAAPNQLTVTKTGAGTGTVTSSPAGIECGAVCSAAFPEWQSVVLSAAPGPGSEAAQWSGCDSVKGEDKCIVAMSAAKAVSAGFSVGNRQLTVTKTGTGSGTVTSSPAGIECGAVCAAPFTLNATVTLTGTRGTHTQAAQWSGCDKVTAGKCEVAMSAAAAVTASFEREPQFLEYPVAIERTGTGFGTVASAPAGIECGILCSGEFLVNTKLRLSATPAVGSVFARFSGGGCSGITVCETTVKGAKTVRAAFTAVGTRILSVAKAGRGAGTVKSRLGGIDCGSTCSSQVPAPTKVTLTATAASGSSFAGFSGPCSGIAPCTLRMNEAHQVSATFAAGASSPPAPAPVPGCKKGFRKKKVNGKLVCKKRKRHHHRSKKHKKSR